MRKIISDIIWNVVIFGGNLWILFKLIGVL